jgi:hypothetical protein
LERGESFIGFWWENMTERELRRPKRRWEDNIKMDLHEVECGGIHWIELAQDRQVVVMKLRVPWNVGNFLTGCKPVSFSRRTVLCGVSE